jgi:NAD(P)-dependent dehydrogenase (short-subunit alcohol dehydrogenase family)
MRSSPQLGLNMLIYSGQEMAGTAVYLASRAGGYVNGQEIIIDGGYTTVNPSTV